METISTKKPAPLKVIFILNTLMCILPFVFYAVAQSKGGSIGGLEPSSLIYAALGYIACFTFLILGILTRRILLMRLAIVLVLVNSIPYSAFIGYGFAVISTILSFTPKVKNYFEAR